MSKRRPLRDVELVKLLLDPRRSRILELADHPVSVNELAEKIGELPSRVYYHVHKLVEAGLLELADTRQHGNLIEKLYRSTSPDLHFSVDPALFGKISSVTMQVEQMLVPGLRLIEYSAKLRAGRMQKDPTDAQRHPDDPLVHMSISWDNLTESEWRAKTKALDAVVGIQNEDGHTENPDREPSVNTSTGPQHRFAFIVLSYRLEDAEMLGSFKNENSSEDDFERSL
ncbi:MAG: winged helix-turn-helix domain-containing protein [Alicyclobacillus sp.]|nr:winged helix-turn-helix domain-containing protein [Alicyclobacillus sp.]